MMFEKIDNIKGVLPMLKQMPEKVGDLEMDLHDLEERMIQNYVTFNQVEETIRLYTVKIDKKYENMIENSMKEFREEVVAQIPPKALIARIKQSLDDADNQYGDDATNIYDLNQSLSVVKRQANSHESILKNTRFEDLSELKTMIKERPEQK